MKKVFVLQAKDEFELVKKINEEQEKKDVFASQTHQKLDGNFIAFVFFNSDVKSNVVSQKKSSLTTSNSKRSSFGKPFTPTKEQLVKWKDEDVTDGQKRVLKEMGMSDTEIQNASKLDAHHIINNNNRENI